LKGWLLNASRAKALLYFGGNGEDVGAERDSLAKMFPNRAVFLLPYRGYGPNAGTPSEKVIFSDALALYDAAHAHHVAIAVVGRSLGTGVASYITSKRQVERLALVTPFDNFASAAQARFSLVPVNLLLKDHYDSADYVRGYSGPALILRAGNDGVIPASSTDRLIAVFDSKPRVVNFPDAGHNSISDDPGYARALSQFMR
jgi:pimeloyl-ACP methyl ester carboxylesterase